MDALISALVTLEWDFFQHVHAVGGRASCQDDYVTFERMRRSQFMAWSRELCQLWLQELRAAKSMGRNPVAEKYARMMEVTAPGEYARIEHLLPSVPPENRSLIEMLCTLHLAWQRQCAARYPKLAARSRPAVGQSSRPGDTSFVAYLKGELLTYSPELLKAYALYATAMQGDGVNVYESVLGHMVRLAGYASAAEAENCL